MKANDSPAGCHAFSTRGARRGLSIVLLLAGVAGCSDEGWLSQGIVARREILSDVTEAVILPSFESLRAAGAGLSSVTTSFAESPSPEGLEAVRAAWRSGRAAWNSCDGYLVDPPFDPGQIAKIDTYPVDAARLESALAGDQPIDLARIEALGSTLKGFFALEYLVFSEPDDRDAVLQALTDGDLGARRRAYASAVAAVLARDLAAAADQWSASGRDLGGELGRDEPMALDRLGARLAVLTETVADRRLGAPLGKTSGGVPQPRDAESERSGNSLRDVLSDLQGLRNVYVGRFEGHAGPGLDELVHAASEDLDASYRGALEAAIAAVEAIPEPLTEAVESDRAVVEAAYVASKELARRTATDLVSGLGTSLGFSPFDGD